MKRVIKSITASTLPEGVRYLMGDPDDEYALEGYGDGYKVVTFDEIIEDMVSDIKTDDLIIRVFRGRPEIPEYYTLASKRGKNFYSYWEEFDEILQVLLSKEKPEYDVATKTIYNSPYGVDCAELPQDVLDSWLDQAATLYDSKFFSSKEILGYMFNGYDFYEDGLDKLSPNPKDLF